MTEGRRSPGEIRAELRALGYLEGPLARFVAGGRGGSLLATSLGVGARVGALLGTFVSLLLLVGYVALDRFLLLRSGDLALLFLYLLAVGLAGGALFGLLLGAFFAGAFALLRRAPHRAELASGKTSVAAGLLIAVYLGLAWTRLRGRLGEPALLPDLAACLAAVLAGFLAAVAVRPATLFLLARVGKAPVLNPKESRRGRAAAVLLGLGGAALFALALRIGEGRHREGTGPADFAVRETGARALLLACDGEDASFVDRLAAEGGLPNLRALRDRSARFDLDASAYPSPPVFWTSVATGLPVGRHGVERAGTVRPRGFAGDLLVDRAAVGFYEVLHVVLPTLRLARETPLTASLLAERTVFEVVGLRGLPVGLVNYWLTHPAPEVAGFAFSERAYWKARFNATAASRGKRRLPARGESHPPELFEGFASLAEAPASPADRGEALDRSVEKALLAFAPLFSPRLTAAGFWGLDTLLHASLSGGSGPAADVDTARRLSSAYASLDARIGRIIESEVFRDSTVFFVSFPGSARRPGSERRYNGDRGLFWIAGSRVRTGAAGNASPLDLAPTLLALLGFPASAEMPGRALAEAFDSGALVEAPRVSTFGKRPRAAGAGKEEFDDAMASILRDLGYL